MDLYVDEAVKLLNAYRSAFDLMHPREKEALLLKVENGAQKALLVRDWARSLMEPEEPEEMSTE